MSVEEKIYNTFGEEVIPGAMTPEEHQEQRRKSQKFRYDPSETPEARDKKSLRTDNPAEVDIYSSYVAEESARGSSPRFEDDSPEGKKKKKSVRIATTDSNIDYATFGDDVLKVPSGSSPSSVSSSQSKNPSESEIYNTYGDSDDPASSSPGSSFRAGNTPKQTSGKGLFGRLNQAQSGVPAEDSIYFTYSDSSTPEGRNKANADRSRRGEDDAPGDAYSAYGDASRVEGNRRGSPRSNSPRGGGGGGNDLDPYGAYNDSSAGVSGGSGGNRRSSPSNRGGGGGNDLDPYGAYNDSSTGVSGGSGGNRRSSPSNRGGGGGNDLDPYGAYNDSSAGASGGSGNRRSSPSNRGGGGGGGNDLDPYGAYNDSSAGVSGGSGNRRSSPSNRGGGGNDLDPYGAYNDSSAGASGGSGNRRSSPSNRGGGGGGGNDLDPYGAYNDSSAGASSGSGNRRSGRGASNNNRDVDADIYNTYGDNSSGRKSESESRPAWDVFGLFGPGSASVDATKEDSTGFLGLFGSSTSKSKPSAEESAGLSYDERVDNVRLSGSGGGSSRRAGGRSVEDDIYNTMGGNDIPGSTGIRGNRPSSAQSRDGGRSNDYDSPYDGPDNARGSSRSFGGGGVSSSSRTNPNASDDLYGGMGADKLSGGNAMARGQSNRSPDPSGRDTYSGGSGGLGFRGGRSGTNNGDRDDIYSTMAGDNIAGSNNLAGGPNRGGSGSGPSRSRGATGSSNNDADDIYGTMPGDNVTGTNKLAAGSSSSGGGKAEGSGINRFRGGPDAAGGFIDRSNTTAGGKGSGKNNINNNSNNDADDIYGNMGGDNTSGTNSLAGRSSSSSPARFRQGRDAAGGFLEGSNYTDSSTISDNTNTGPSDADDIYGTMGGDSLSGTNKLAGRAGLTGRSRDGNSSGGRNNAGGTADDIYGTMGSDSTAAGNPMARGGSNRSGGADRSASPASGRFGGADRNNADDIYGTMGGDNLSGSNSLAGRSGSAGRSRGASSGRNFTDGGDDYPYRDSESNKSSFSSILNPITSLFGLTTSSNDPSTSTSNDMGRSSSVRGGRGRAGGGGDNDDMYGGMGGDGMSGSNSLAGKGRSGRGASGSGSGRGGAEDGSGGGYGSGRGDNDDMYGGMGGDDMSGSNSLAGKGRSGRGASGSGSGRGGAGDGSGGGYGSGGGDNDDMYGGMGGDGMSGSNSLAGKGRSGRGASGSGSGRGGAGDGSGGGYGSGRGDNDDMYGGMGGDGMSGSNSLAGKGRSGRGASGSGSGRGGAGDGSGGGYGSGRGDNDDMYGGMGGDGMSGSNSLAGKGRSGRGASGSGSGRGGAEDGSGGGYGSGRGDNDDMYGGMGGDDMSGSNSLAGKGGARSRGRNPSDSNASGGRDDDMYGGMGGYDDMSGGRGGNRMSEGKNSNRNKTGSLWSNPLGLFGSSNDKDKDKDEENKDLYGGMGYDDIEQGKGMGRKAGSKGRSGRGNSNSDENDLYGGMGSENIPGGMSASEARRFAGLEPKEKEKPSWSNGFGLFPDTSNTSGNGGRGSGGGDDDDDLYGGMSDDSNLLGGNRRGDGKDLNSRGKSGKGYGGFGNSPSNNGDNNNNNDGDLYGTGRDPSMSGGNGKNKTWTNSLRNILGSKDSNSSKGPGEDGDLYGGMNRGDAIPGGMTPTEARSYSSRHSISGKPRQKSISNAFGLFGSGDKDDDGYSDPGSGSNSSWNPFGKQKSRNSDDSNGDGLYSGYGDSEGGDGSRYSGSRASRSRPNSRESKPLLDIDGLFKSFKLYSDDKNDHDHSMYSLYGDQDVDGDNMNMSEEEQRAAFWAMRSSSGSSEDEMLDPGQRHYPEPLSNHYRFLQAFSYTAAGFSYLLGSLMYFPFWSIYDEAGGMYLLGSCIFFFAAFIEWWANNKTGCIFDKQYRQSYEKSIGKHFEPRNTWYGRYQRAENGLNHFLLVVAAFMNLIGSILIIPSLGYGDVEANCTLYVFAGYFVMTSPLWKLYRIATFNRKNPSDRTFSLKNWQRDMPLFWTEVLLSMNGFFFGIGSIYSLPSISTTDDIIYFWSELLTAGSLCMMFSGLLMFWRYFIVQKAQYNRVVI